jgi:small subunit ribosomal protein S19
MIEQEKKVFTLRGKNLEELKKMDIREFAKYITSRERRTILRNFARMEKSLQRWKRYNDRGKQIRTHDRDIIIVPQMIGLTVYVYNGKEFLQIKMTEEMLGHRLGEFSVTRKGVKHGSPGIGATRSSSFMSVK